MQHWIGNENLFHGEFKLGWASAVEALHFWAAIGGSLTDGLPVTN